MKANNFVSRFIVVTLTAALLLVSGSRAIRVQAVGTTAAIAGTAFILTGAVYLSYVALTQGEMILPAAEEMHNWLGGIGRKVSQYSSGASAYQEIYQGLLKDPTANVIDGVWTWTQDKLKSFVNDFSDTRIIDNIVAYSITTDEPLANFNFSDYSVYIPQDVYSNNTYSLSYVYQYYDVAQPLGPRIAIVSANTRYFPFYTNINTEVRNFKSLDGYYYPQILVNGTWQNINSVNAMYRTYQKSNGDFFRYLIPQDIYGWKWVDTQGVTTVSRALMPPFIDSDIYDEQTNTLIPARDNNLVDRHPNWLDPDNENRPIVPWVPIPELPINVTPPTGYINPQWGFNLQDLLDKLEDLAGTLIDIGGIAALINEFAGLHGDEYYIEYNDGDTYYYTYYQPTVFDNDSQYITYNIDLSEQQDIIPVDLNTIQIYTDNTYLERVKEHARNAGDIFANYVAFWHNCDSDLVYTVFGAAILVLVGAFVGKWGHS